MVYVRRSSNTRYGEPLCLVGLKAEESKDQFGLMKGIRCLNERFETDDLRIRRLRTLISC